VPLTDSGRKALAEIGKKLGRQALEELATVAKPDTILAWHRKCMDQQTVSAQESHAVGRPRIAKELEDLVVRMAREHRSWGFDRIVGALSNLGYSLSAQTVGNILKRHELPPAPERKKTTTWRAFIRIHMDMLMATDFFTSEVWVRCELVIAYFFCFIHVSRHPVGAVRMMLSLCAQWKLASLPRSRVVNAYVQRWVRLGKVEALSWLIRFDEGVLAYTRSTGMPHTHRHLLPQGMGKVIRMSPFKGSQIQDGPRLCRKAA
jgi:hypothetical protein